MTESLDGLIPEQQTGAKTDTEHSVEFKSAEEAKKYFQLAKQRLQDVNRWHEMAGSLTAGFKLIDEKGAEVDRPAKTGDYFKISIPAPGPRAGDGYDWVRIELMDDKTASTEENEAFGIRVRPAESPENAEPAVAHFFKEDATSTFIVERNGKTVKAAVHGRNELPNTTADKPLDKARNAVVALGAMLGLSNPQWKSLVKGILEFDDR
jgi:hypothetical protein